MLQAINIAHLPTLPLDLLLLLHLLRQRAVILHHLVDKSSTIPLDFGLLDLQQGFGPC